MALIKWGPDLSVEVNAMDDQHEQIVDLMNKLHDLKEDDFQVQFSVLNQLRDVTVSHFSEEEKYMEEIEFPKLDTHKLIHKDLLEKFGNFYSKIESEQNIPAEFYEFLTMWLRAHICGIDKQYGEHSKLAA